MAQRTVTRHFNCSKRISFGILHSDCATHCLNLSASAAVKVLAIQNVKNVARKVVKMFKISAKKTALLKSCIKENVYSQEETKRYLVGLCETRFVERYVSIPLCIIIRGKNFNKFCQKFIQNALKWLLQYVNFQIFSGGACPQDPLEPFFCCSSTCFKSILPEKTTLEKMLKFRCLFLKKISHYTSNIKHF